MGRAELEHYSHCTHHTHSGRGGIGFARASALDAALSARGRMPSVRVDRSYRIARANVVRWMLEASSESETAAAVSPSSRYHPLNVINHFEALMLANGSRLQGRYEI